MLDQLLSPLSSGFAPELPRFLRTSVKLRRDPARSYFDSTAGLPSAEQHMQEILDENVIPFWLGDLLYEDHGGFRLNHDVRGRWRGPAPRRLVTQTRMLWFLARLKSAGHSHTGIDALANGGLAFSVTLGYLSRELDGRVPPTALDSVEADAGDPDDLSLEVAILGALPGSFGRMMHIVRTTPGVRPRSALLRTLLFPSPAALRATRPDGPGAPLAYLARPLGLIGRRTTIWLRGGFASCSRSARAAISGRITRGSSHRAGIPPSR